MREDEHVWEGAWALSADASRVVRVDALSWNLERHWPVERLKTLVASEESPGARRSPLPGGRILRAWDADDGRLLWSHRDDAHARTEWGGRPLLAVSRTGAYLAAPRRHRAGERGYGENEFNPLANGRAEIWDVGAGRHVHTVDYPGELAALALSPQGDRLAAALRGFMFGAVHVWELHGRRRRWALASGHDVVEHLAFSPDGPHLAAWEDNLFRAPARAWDLRVRKYRYRRHLIGEPERWAPRRPSDLRATSPRIPLRPDQDMAMDPVWISDDEGRPLLFGTYADLFGRNGIFDGALWDPQPAGPSSGIRWVQKGAVSSDERVLALAKSRELPRRSRCTHDGSFNVRIEARRRADGARVAVLPPVEGPIAGLAFTADGGHLRALTCAGVMHTWETRRWQPAGSPLALAAPLPPPTPSA